MKEKESPNKARDVKLGKCFVLNCKSTGMDTILYRFHTKFGRDTSKFKEWWKIVGRGPFPNSFQASKLFICENHFPQDDKIWTRLRCNAVPKLNLPAFESNIKEPIDLPPPATDQDNVNTTTQETISSVPEPQKVAYDKISEKCAVLNCTSKKGEIPLHIFPKYNEDYERFSVWLRATGREGVNQEVAYICYRICHKHFADVQKIGNRLVTGAIPTLYLPDIVKKPTIEKEEIKKNAPTSENIKSLSKKVETIDLTAPKTSTCDLPSTEKVYVFSAVDIQTSDDVLPTVQTVENMSKTSSTSQDMILPVGSNTKIAEDPLGTKSKSTHPNILRKKTPDTKYDSAANPIAESDIKSTGITYEQILTLLQNNSENKETQQFLIVGAVPTAATSITKNDAAPSNSVVEARIVDDNEIQILDEENDRELTRSVGIQTGPNIIQVDTHPQKKVFLSPESIQTLCRVCLIEPGIEYLHNNVLEGLDYAEVLEYITGLKLGDGNPRLICKTCEGGLIKAYTFKKQSQKSEHVLQMFKDEVEQQKRKSNILNTKKRLQDHDYDSASLDLDQPAKKFKPSEESTDKNPIDLLQEPKEPSLPNTVDLNLTEQSTPTTSPADKKIVSRFYMYKGNPNDKIDYSKLVEINRTVAMTMAKNKIKYKRVYTCPPTIRQYENLSVARRASVLARAGFIEEARKLTQNVNISRRLKRLLYKKPKPEKILYPTDCKTCGERLETEQTYKAHVAQTKHFHTPFPCDHCSKVFPSERTLQSHKEQLDMAVTSKLCETCGATFSSTLGLQLHVKQMHGSIEKYKCGVCGKSHSDLRHLIRHRKLVHPGVHTPKTVVCELCGIKVATRGSLYAHKRRVHLKIMPLRCAICDGKFHNRQQLRKHQGVHSLDQFDCGFCNKIFKHKEKFDTHRKLVHPALSTNADVSSEYVPSPCTFCETVCPNKQSLSVHLRDHRIEVCIFCDEIFRDEDELSLHHLEMHGNIMEWSCRYCNKLYADRDGLSSHLVMHKYRSFKCEECPKMFDALNKLKRHQMLHDGVMNYECRFCPRRYRYSTSVVIHERVHTGERPYKCDICGKGHMCASSRGKHRQTHFINPNDSLNMEILAMEASSLNQTL